MFERSERVRHTGLALLLLTSVGSSLTFGAAQAQSSLPLTGAAARSVFEEAVRMSAQDAGSLWGAPFYGPMLIVDRGTRTAVANERVSLFRADKDVFVGVLPDDVGIANTAVDWHGEDGRC